MSEKEEVNKIVNSSANEEESPKAKKARKPFVWTPARKAAFDKCKKARESKIKVVKEKTEEEKSKLREERNHISELIKNTQRLKEVLALLETKSNTPVEAPKAKVEEPIQQRKQIRRIPTQVYHEEDEDSYEDEGDEADYVDEKPNHFRYKSNTRHLGVPKPPTRSPSVPTNNSYVKNSYFDKPTSQEPGPSFVFL